MSIDKIIRFWVASLTIIVVSFSHSIASELSPDNLFTRVSHETLDKQQMHKLKIIKAKLSFEDINIVRIRIDLLNKDKPSFKVHINVFPEINSVLTTERIERRSRNDFSWYGAESSSHNQSILTINGEDIVGTLRIGRQLYNVRPISNGLHAILKVNENAFIDHPPSKK